MKARDIKLGGFYWIKGIRKLMYPVQVLDVETRFWRHADTRYTVLDLDLLDLHRRMNADMQRRIDQDRERRGEPMTAPLRERAPNHAQKTMVPSRKFRRPMNEEEVATFRAKGLVA